MGSIIRDSRLLRAKLTKMSSRPSSDLAKFREKLKESEHLVILTGAGVSAESGVPTFRGAGGFWRTYRAQDLATPEAFQMNPSLVWEFYHYRREVMLHKHPNPAHEAIAEIEKRFSLEGKKVVVITQNIDELHGSLFRVRCTRCWEITENRDSPICEALRDRGAPDREATSEKIPAEKLPRCKKTGCGGLLRPHVVWFGEGLNSRVLEETEEHLELCDLCLVVGTSSIVYPAAMFAPQVARRGVPVAEFNLECTPNTDSFVEKGFYFEGPCGQTLPAALAPTH